MNRICEKSLSEEVRRRISDRLVALCLDEYQRNRSDAVLLAALVSTAKRHFEFMRVYPQPNCEFAFATFMLNSFGKRTFLGFPIRFRVQKHFIAATVRCCQLCYRPSAIAKDPNVNGDQTFAAIGYVRSILLLLPEPSQYRIAINMILFS